MKSTSRHVHGGGGKPRVHGRIDGKYEIELNALTYEDVKEVII